MNTTFARLILLAVLWIGLMPHAALAQDDYDDGGSAPAFLGTFFDELRLGARFEVGTYRWSYVAPPLVEGMVFLGDGVENRLEPAWVNLYGLEAGLAFRGLELFGSFRTNEGIEPRSEMTSLGGDEVASLNPGIQEYGVRADYVADEVLGGLSLGGGLAYRYHYTSIQQTTPAQTLFTGSTSQHQLIPYVTLQRALGGKLAAHLRLGASVLSRHSTDYEVWFGVYPEDLDRPVPNSEVYYDFPEGDPRMWFAEMGAEFAVDRFPLRATFRVERTTLDDVFTETLTGLNLRLGLPF